ncbi:hypothetical protein, partial [Salmonella sp. s51933]|uniref:hypothetical protein n=1 Tax=Salmonella sp. s51933 TaxID=3160127 RepID=UPI003754068E
DCNIWQTDPCGRKGICWDYKTESMSKSMAIFGFLVTALSITFYFLSWYFCESPQTQNNNSSELINANGLSDGLDQETNL